MPKPETAMLFLDNVERSGLVDPFTLSEFRRRCDQSELPEQPEDLAELLVTSGQLTEFQAKQLLAGKSQGFIISGRYKILDRLGAGGMGAVFLCEHTVMRHKIALKVLPREQARDLVALERFRREARAVATLNHPNIIRAFDISEDGGLHYLVLEYVEGRTLHELVRRDGPLDVARAADYIRQAALGLQHAFEANLVHRDIKPGNILLDRSGVVKVLDLGLARFFLDPLDNLTTEHDAQAILGTADYISPEQSVNSHDVDIRSDIYSLGATFYFLLAGQAPFSGKTVTEKLTQHQTQQPEPLRRLRPDVPLEVEAIVHRMMARKPSRRFQVPQDVVIALTPWAMAEGLPGIETPAGDAATEASLRFEEAPTPANPLADITRPTLAVPAAPARQAAQARQRGRKRLLALAAVVLTLGGGGALAWILSHPPQRAASSGPASPPGLLVANPPSSDRGLVTSLSKEDEDQYLQRVAALAGEQQTQAVLERLKLVNPGFEGNTIWGTPTYKDEQVIGLGFTTDQVTDLRPLRALVHLRSLHCVGSRPGLGRIEDLTPLQGLPLAAVSFNSNPGLSEFDVLQGLPLIFVNLPNTRLDSLECLRGKPIKKLVISGTKVADLSVLAAMPLEDLTIAQTPVSDLGPLRKLALKTLDCTGTRVRDFSPLVGLPLTKLEFDLQPGQDLAWLRSLKGLESINKMAPADFWKKVP